jgi:hypothetical protein
MPGPWWDKVRCLAEVGLAEVGRVQQGLPWKGGHTQKSRGKSALFHNVYVEDELRRGVRTNDFDPASPDCPHTFRTGCSLDEFGGSDEDLLLIGVGPRTRKLADWYVSGVRSVLELPTISDDNEFGVIFSILEEKSHVLDGLEEELVSATRYLYSVRP